MPACKRGTTRYSYNDVFHFGMFAPWNHMTDLQISFNLSNPWAFPAYGVPLRCSVPLPQGAVTDPARELVLSGSDGADCGAQWRVLSRWQDGSARFALMDYAEKTIAPRGKHGYTLTARASDGAPVTGQGITVAQDAASLTVDTGRLTWRFSKKRFSLAESITFNGREWIGSEKSDLIVEDGSGQIYRASAGEYEISLEEHGPHRVIVLIRGDYRNPVGRFMNYWMRFHFVAGGSQVLMLHHTRNREPGRQGRDLRRSSLEGGLAVNETAVRRILHTARTVNTMVAPLDVAENVDIDIEDYETRIRNEASLREDQDDICFSLKHRLQPGTNCACAPLLDLHEPGAGGMLMKIQIPDPNGEAPMRLASEGDRFAIDFFPVQREPYHLNEGMGKTRDILLHFHDDSLGTMDLVHSSDTLSYPGVVGVPHEVYRAARFADVHRTLVRQPNKYPLLEKKIDFMKCPGDIQNKQAIKANPLLGQCRGWRDFGDYVGLRGHMPEHGVRQYYNNEEDYIYCAMIDAWRTGRPYDARDNVRHLMDIDYIDFSTDPARDGAVCPHSTNHTDGEVYLSHQWCQGLLYFYLATGDEEALRIARRIGDALIWFITGPRSFCLTGSGRESAWPLLSLSALYEVTGEEKYRDAGMVIVNGMLDTVEKHGHMVWEYPLGSGILTSYMLFMTFNGVWDLYAATGDEKILKLYKILSEPVLKELESPHSFGYVHFRNAHLMMPDLTVLVRWYEMTGDEKFVRLGRNGLRMVLAAAPEPLIQSDSNYAMLYRHMILFLKLADEHGMIDDDHVTLVW